MLLVASAVGACGSRDANGPLTPVSLTITPNPKTLKIGQSQQFTVTGTNSDGDEIAVSPTWSVTNDGGTISASTGSFTAGFDVGTFTNTVRATSGSVFAEATVVVIADPVAGPVLKSAAANGIMAGQSFTCVTNGTINANISISPGSTVTGFPPCVITGVQHLADAVALQAQVDLTAAYDSLMGLPCPGGNLITTDIGATTKAPGVYCSATSIGVTGALTLDAGNDTSATFVFQAGSTLITAGNIVLINGAKAGNVYWVVGSSATLGTSSQWQGNIIALTSITLVDNATLIGRALARNGSVSLGTNNTITLP
ncbi:MAG: ice-binding family protein [Gemmatimonadota bacterium]